MALPFRAPFIILFSGIGAASLAGSYRQHHSRLVLALALVGFILIAGSKFLPPGLKAAALGIEGAGFICMAAGNVLAFRATRLGGRSCSVRSAGRSSLSSSATASVMLAPSGADRLIRVKLIRVKVAPSGRTHHLIT